MIRRQWQNSAGTACWVLISQVEHALISGRLAHCWATPLVDPPAADAELRAAIEHHDDGWHDWERAPQLEPELGRPRDFTEMPQEQALAIWAKSIRAAEQLGPLAAWCVSRHFCLLLERFGDWETMSHQEGATARRFLEVQQQHQVKWLASWHDGPEPNQRQATAERAVAWLQMFDALSLWLCCAPRQHPHEVTAPDGSRLTFTPSGAPMADSPIARLDYEVAVAPWPWAVPRLELAADALVVPATSYTDWEEVQAAAIGRMTVRWVMTAGRAVEP